MKKIIAITTAALLVLLALLYGGFILSKSRTFQFFGGLTYRVETDQKVVALTFDDAPGPNTREVLNELDKHNIKVTFFMVGDIIKRHRGDAKAIVVAGHELGNHSYSHQRMVLKPPAFVANEIERTDELIKSIGYEDLTFFRPPTGKKFLVLPWYLAQNNRKTIMWDIEPNTYFGPKDDAQKLAKYTIARVRPGSIILLHPFGDGNRNTREALPEIITTLKRQGYRFVTISDLLELDKR